MNFKCVVGAGYTFNRHAIDVPKGDSVELRFALYNMSGQEFDTANITTATFTVAEGQVIGGTFYAGGETDYTLSLGSGISKAGDLYTLVVNVPSATTASVENVFSYYELVIGLTGGAMHTVSSGLYRSDRTLRADGY